MASLGGANAISSSQATHLTDENGILPLWIKVTYAIPRFTIRANYIIQSAYLTYFYESIGAKLTYIAAYVAIARSFDVITDPGMGWLTDNTHTRFGRRKPFLVAGSVFYNALLLLLLMPPQGLSGNAVSHWFGLTYTVFFLFDTFTSIPYYAFGMEMTNNFGERNMLWFWNQLSGNLGTLVGMALPAGLTAAVTGNLYTVFAITGVIFAVVHAAGMAANVLLIAERPDQAQTGKAAAAAASEKSGGGAALHPEANAEEEEEPAPCLDTEKGGACDREQSPAENAAAEPHAAPFVVNLLRCFRNLPFECIIKSYFLDYLAVGMIAAMTPFYVGYVLLRPQGGNVDDADEVVVTIGTLAVALFVAALLSVPAWERLAAHTGKYRAWIYYSVWNAVTCPFFAVCGTSKTAAYVVAFLNGSAIGGQFLLDSIVNDVAEYDTMCHGDSIEGCFVAIQTFVPKIVLVAAMSLPFAVIAAAGFVSSRCVPENDGADDVPDTCDGASRAPEPQSATVRWLIVAFFCVVPTAATLLSIHYKLKYPIKTEALAAAVSEARAAHGRGEAAKDPLTGTPIGPLCIARVNDPDRRKALMALAHLSDASVRRYASSAHRDPAFLEQGLRVGAYGSAALLAACVLLAALTFSWLEEDRWAWVPILACVAVGALVVFVYVRHELLAQLPLLRHGVTARDTELYLGKLDGQVLVAASDATTDRDSSSGRGRGSSSGRGGGSTPVVSLRGGGKGSGIATPVGGTPPRTISDHSLEPAAGSSSSRSSRGGRARSPGNGHRVDRHNRTTDAQARGGASHRPLGSPLGEESARRGGLTAQATAPYTSGNLNLFNGPVVTW